MNRDVRAVSSHRPAAAALAVLALATLAHCGGGSSSPVSPPTPTPTATPAPTPTPPGLVCNPTPPPLYGITIKVHVDSGFRKILDSRPYVINVDGYCEKAVGKSGACCVTRTEGDEQAVACDYLAVGKAADTGRYGPTWFWEGKPCAAEGETTPGCRNNPNDQFLVIAKGPGVYEACAAPDVPLSEDPEHLGSRCGRIEIP
jgi:hypothetical protein